MSERDTSGTSGRDTPATSPYDEPTGQIPVPGAGGGVPGAGTGPGAARPEAGPPTPPAVTDRDDFYNRHARRSPAPYSRVDDLDDLDPGDVETRPAAAGPPTTSRPAATPPRSAAPAPGPAAPADDDFETVQFATPPGPARVQPADDAVTTPEPALPPAGTARYDFLDDDDDASSRTRARDESAATEVVDDEPRARRRFGRRRTDDDTDVRPDAAADDDLEEALAKSRRGTIDLGLLVLRVALGGLVGAHGLQKLFGLWNGPRLSGFESMLVDAGFTADYAQILAIVGALSETIGGLMVILGLLTPIGASAILGTMLVAAAFKMSMADGFSFFAAAGGVEFELFLAVAAAVVILTGPGLYSLDYPRGWARRPFVGSFLWLIVGAAAAVAVWVLANGSNPLV
ncbi:DoxX family protein [Gordonia sp. KTR9]|uniref:DoxX family protein n=1 Tax=Gordonia sp. KTR9 TaxID=337191 RepID=UPI00027DE8B0|nr:DoxX family protein [Gordonia sp. KTR9]AFR49908.1 DoxX family protein [Gordonia sp. KTR9]